jgi:hypothetical protein
MQTIYYPKFAITWAKKLGLEEYSLSRSGMLIEIWDETPSTPVLLKRLWDKNGGTFGDNNHPDGASLSVADNSIIKVVLYHLANHNIPMQAIVINSDTGIISGTDSNIPSTYPKGIVDGAGTIDASTVPLYKAVVAGASTVFKFKAAPQSTNSWYKINCNILFGNVSGLTMTDPNNGTVYGTEIFQLDYYGGNIRWPNPSLSSGNQAFLENTALWPTENSFSENQWYKTIITAVGCSKLVNGLKLSTWNNAGNGDTMLNQPFETWNFGWGGYRVIKVLKRASDGVTPLWFEVRGKDAYRYFLPYAANIDGTEVDCSNLLGNLIGLNIDDSVSTAVGYDKDGVVFKLSTSLCPEPTIIASCSNPFITIGGVLTIVSSHTNATSYQWYKDNQVLLGATSDSYVKNNCTISDAGTYYCKAINSCGGGSTPSQKDSNTVAVALSSNLLVYFPVSLQGNCTGGIERGWSLTNNISGVNEWYQSEEVPIPQHGNYYFFARLIVNHAEFVVTGLTNTETLKTK